MKQLKKAYVEITNACNRNCPFCPGTAREKAFMPERDFRRVAGELAGRAQCLYFHVLGEPLLHPQIGAFLDIAANAGLPVNITTNGTLLGAVGDVLLGKPALRQVSISLHCLNNETQGRRYLEEAIAFARDARRDGRVLIAYRLWNEHEGEGTLGNGWIKDRLLTEYGMSSFSGKGRCGGTGVGLAEGIYLNLAELFQWPDLRNPEIGREGFCMGLRDQIGILCDGTVVPCCLDAEGTIALGNIFKSPLEEILSSDRAKSIYDGFSSRKAVEELCRKCGYRQRFD